MNRNKVLIQYDKRTIRKTLQREGAGTAPQAFWQPRKGGCGRTSRNYWGVHERPPDDLKGTPLVLEEQKLRKLMTDDDRELIDVAHKDATEQTLWERITKSNHKDVTYYKGLLQEYTRDLLMVMREDFLEEITGHHIGNKTFEDD